MNQIIARAGLAKISLSGEIIAPQHKVKTIQNTQSKSILFSIGKDHRFYAIKENDNDAEHQWTKIDLTDKIGSQAKVIDFTLSTEGNQLDIALATEENGVHKLYVSTENTVDSNLDSLEWQHIKYDDILSSGNPRFDKIIIKQLNLQTVDEVQYLSVFTDDGNRLFKYYIDLEEDQKWNPREFAVDYDRALIDTCVGMTKRADIPGLYTLGNVGGKRYILFTPLYNVYDPSVNPTVVSLHTASTPMDALATLAMGKGDDKGKTDLFAAGAGKLYHFPYKKQLRDAEGELVFEHELFTDVANLEVLFEHDQYVVWANNRHGEIFYTTCKKSEINNKKAWSNPVVILKDVDQMTSLYNRATHEFTFFALKRSNDLLHAVRCPKTSVWNYSDVIIPKAKSDVEPRNGYLTNVLVTDEDGKPLRDCQVSIKTSNPARVYINKRYYALNDKPVSVITNKDGRIEIEEVTDNLQAASFVLNTEDAEELRVIPMDSAMHKINRIQNTGDLDKLEFTSHQSQDEKLKILELVKKASQVYHGTANDIFLPSPTPLLAVAGPNVALAVSREGISDDLLGGAFDWFSDGVKKATSFAGDVCKHIGEFAKKMTKTVIGFAEGAWRVVTEIAGKIYHFVLETAKSALDVITNLFIAIGKTAKELWDKLMNVSKGTDAYIQTFGTHEASISIAGQSSSASLKKDIHLKDFPNYSIEMSAHGHQFTGTVEPVTGLLFSSDFGHQMKTPSIITDDYVINYGFYDAGPGYVELPDRNQAYIYVGDNHSNWMGDMLEKFKDKEVLISDLVLPGSHDAGMCVDIPTSVSLLLRGMIAGAGLLVGAIVPIVGTLLSPLLFGAAVVYSPKRISRNQAVTQKESIKTQLEIGSRYFDFRPGYNLFSGEGEISKTIKNLILGFAKKVTKDISDGDIKSLSEDLVNTLEKMDFSECPISHQHAVIPGVLLSTMIEEATDFLATHPNEIVIVNIRFNGIMFDSMKPSYDVINEEIDKHLKGNIKKVNVITNKEKDEYSLPQDYTSWAEFSKCDVNTLIQENKRLILVYDPDMNSSYDDDQYHADKMINQMKDTMKNLENPTETKTGKKIDPNIALTNLELQGTYSGYVFNNVLKKGKIKYAELALALASFTNAGSWLMSTKPSLDGVIYPWLQEKFVPDSKEGTIIISNDFVDIGMVSIAAEATHKRLMEKSTA